eukprot:scaffold141024_cov14-Tisochrysis_lutea.AAC.1
MAIVQPNNSWPSASSTCMIDTAISQKIEDIPKTMQWEKHWEPRGISCREGKGYIAAPAYKSSKQHHRGLRHHLLRASAQAVLHH